MKFLLVGQMFSQGAPALIAKGLPQRAEVTLRAEPENPYDANAVKVWVDRDAVMVTDELTEALAAFGMSLETIEWPLAIGHLGAKAETKAAKAASREGHQFALCAAWHRLSEPTRSVGKLVQYPNGSNFVEVAE